MFCPYNTIFLKIKQPPNKWGLWEYPDRGTNKLRDRRRLGEIVGLTEEPGFERLDSARLVLPADFVLLLPGLEKLHQELVGVQGNGHPVEDDVVGPQLSGKLAPGRDRFLEDAAFSAIDEPELAGHHRLALVLLPVPLDADDELITEEHDLLGPDRKKRETEVVVLHLLAHDVEQVGNRAGDRQMETPVRLELKALPEFIVIRSLPELVERLDTFLVHDLAEHDLADMRVVAVGPAHEHDLGGPDLAVAVPLDVDHESRIDPTEVVHEVTPAVGLDVLLEVGSNRIIHLFLGHPQIEPILVLLLAARLIASGASQHVGRVERGRTITITRHNKLLSENFPCFRTSFFVPRHHMMPQDF